MLELTKIVDHVYLSDLSSACDVDLLKENNITHVISLLHREEDIRRVSEAHRHLDNLIICVPDDERTNIKQFFGYCFSYIERCIKGGGNILVHCNGGISRSPTIISSYLIRKYGMTMRESLFQIEKVRICIDPNDSFISQLKRCEALSVRKRS